jgi:hypothetical protein
MSSPSVTIHPAPFVRGRSLTNQEPLPPISLMFLFIACSGEAVDRYETPFHRGRPFLLMITGAPPRLRGDESPVAGGRQSRPS